MRFKCVVLFAIGVCSLVTCGCRPSQVSLKNSLMKAVIADDTSTAKKLIKEGADANSREPAGGWSALHYAARNGNVEIVKLLLSAGAEPNYTGTMPGQTGPTLISVTPIALAQSMQAMTRVIPASRVEETVRFSDPGGPALLRSMKDPKATDRYQEVIDVLSKVTKRQR